MTSFVGASLTETYTAAQLTAGATAGKVPNIGQRYDAADGKTYRFVKYNSGAGAVAAVAGNAVGFYAPGGVSTGVTNEVSSDNSDTVAAAGVLMAAPGNGEYGWIQVKGVATLNLALTAGADGNAIYMNAAGTDGALTVMSAVTQSPAGAAIDASAKIVMLNCPF